MNFVPDALLRRKSLYRTRPIEVHVEISNRQQTIDTLEGPVACNPGDAIVTGVKGERYPVPANKFQDKYQPVKEQEGHANGRYSKRIKEVDAAQLHQPLNVQLPSGHGVLIGKPGDWCVWYTETDLAIVACDIFPRLYESDSIGIHVALGHDLTNEDKKSALQTIHSLDVLLPNTTITFSDEAWHEVSEQPLWFRIVKHVSDEKHIIPAVVELSADSVTSSDGSKLINRVKEAVETKSTLAFSIQKLLKTSFKHAKESPEDSLQRIVAMQLTAVEHFNANLEAYGGKLFPYPFIAERNEATEPAALKKICHLGAVADQLATNYQTQWQELVFATTKEIANPIPKRKEIDGPTSTRLEKNGEYLQRLARELTTRLCRATQTLITLGLLAAVMLAAFSELGGRCNINDPWGFEFCASESWEYLAGPVFFFVYLIALGSAWYRYAKAKTEQLEVRHQDYRLLAECIRVMHVRLILGKPACVAADLPAAEPTDSGWVQLALRSIYFDAKQSGIQTTPDDPIKVALAMKSFVKPQVDYHENTLITRRELAIEHLSNAANIGFKLFMIVLVIVTANVIAEIFHHGFLSPMMDHIALISLVLGLGSWGGMRKVISTFGLEEELQRGRLVLSYLAQAEKAGTSEATLDAANYFLDDQAHWHALHRSKPIEATTGG